MTKEKSIKIVARNILEGNLCGKCCFFVNIRSFKSNKSFCKRADVDFIPKENTCEYWWAWETENE